jgi:amphi-Trp domain-containing protein
LTIKELLKLDKERVADLLSFLADGVREGRFTIRAGVQHLSFARSSLPLLRIKASRRPTSSSKYREKIKVVLSWKDATMLVGLDVRPQESGTTVEDAFQPASAVGSNLQEERVLDYLLRVKPDGASLIELGEGLGENWRRLAPVVLRLIGEGKLQKEGKIYKALSGPERGFRVLGH